MTEPKRRPLLRALGWAITAAVSLWSIPAILYSNLPTWSRPVALLMFLGAVAAIVWRTPPGRKRRWALGGLFALLIGLWSLIPPSNDRDWQPDVAVLPTGEIRGNQVLVRNVRNFRYRSTWEYEARYEDRTYDLDRIRSLDFYVVYWSSPSICHTMLSFGFEGDQYLCLSVEARKEKTEAYSAIKGFFRQYELVYILADERDLVRLRTDHRNEQVYLYRLKTTPEEVREVFLDTIRRVNSLKVQPEWYNALTHNCTSNLRDRTAPYARKKAWSWKFLLNGYIDGLVYERGALDQSLPFEELRRRSLINDRAHAGAGGDDPDFSRRIRQGLPGIGP
jgi:hypothetical protein